MRKILIVAIITGVSFLLPGCFDDSKDSLSMESRIQSLENAINTHQYQSFIECFSVDSDMAAGDQAYDSARFMSDYGSLTYDFDICVHTGDNTCRCDTTKSTSGSTVYHNQFTFVKEGDDLVISKWIEWADGQTVDDGTIIWRVKGNSK